MVGISNIRVFIYNLSIKIYPFILKNVYKMHIGGVVSYLVGHVLIEQ